MIDLENTQYWMEHYLTYDIFPAVKPEYVEDVATFLVGIVNDVNEQIDAMGEYDSDAYVELPDCLCLQPTARGFTIQTTMRVEDVIEQFGLWRTNFFHNVDF